MSEVRKRDAAIKALISMAFWVRQANIKTELVAAEKSSVLFEEHYNEFLMAHASVIAITGEMELPYQEIENSKGVDIYTKARVSLDSLLSKLRSLPVTNNVASS